MFADVLSIFDHVSAVVVLHEYMRYILQVVSTSKGATSHIDGTVLTLARLGAFISTAIHCFSDDGVDMVDVYRQNVDGHRQKLYSNTFSSFLPVDFIQLIGAVATFVLQ